MLVSKNQLRINPRVESIYGSFSFENLDDLELFKNITEFGILEPLTITKNYLVISGNRRLRVALAIPEITEVKVEVLDISDENVDDLMILSHNLTRLKDEFVVAQEYETLSRIYGLKQGVKNKQRELEARDKLVQASSFKEKTIQRAREAKKIYLELNQVSEKEAWDYLKVQRNVKKKEVNSILNVLKKKEAEIRNKQIIEDLPIYNEENFKIFHTNNRDLKNIIQDEEVDCIYGSPPYYELRKYVQDNKGKTQDGQEETMEEYLENLIGSIRESLRTLKKTGSIFINITDVRQDGVLLQIPERLSLSLTSNEGVSFIQNILWYKINPVYQSIKAFQPTMEYILHYVKDSKNYKWIDDWFGSEDEFLNNIEYGASEKKRKIKCVFLPPNPKEDGIGVADGIIRTSVFNNSYLVKLMEKNGLSLQHQAISCMEPPMVCILSTTEKGDTIMDPWHGTGTTGLIAYAHGCKYYGIEISKEYAVMSTIRLKDFLEKNPQLINPSQKVSSKSKSKF